ncbi:MAG: PstS family phosphate ABC transporter substrate-binding protein [Nitrososphaerota archaeon]|nr:PstS family phosphate ABC transporter substrate-binding protein [Nitrososphaerales archaeon]MDW8044553.1 PstS family phosphate ABC transporter substrate-binding protein [Nitrososphaerota archaeon]
MEKRSGAREGVSRTVLLASIVTVVVVLIASALYLSLPQQRPATTVTQKLSGSIVIDGSSTVYPISEAVAEAFSKIHPDVKITVGISGTGGGFKRFVIGETDINDASRFITESEKESARRNNIKWIEIPIALEGLAIAVHPSNNWVDCISLEELRMIWRPNSTVKKWSDVNPQWPNADIKLFGPGPDSGTFDYFTERVVGKARASRTDYIPSEDDHVLIMGVSSERYSLGYIPYAYVVAAEGKVKVLAVSEKKGGTCVRPNDETVISGKYPLSRPLFIYVNEDKMLQKPELKAFVEFYIENAEKIVRKVGYTPLPKEYYTTILKLFREGKYTGYFEVYKSLTK